MPRIFLVMACLEDFPIPDTRIEITCELRRSPRLKGHEMLALDLGVKMRAGGRLDVDARSWKVGEHLLLCTAGLIRFGQEYGLPSPRSCVAFALVAGFSAL